ncbi:MAG: hypothetical protein ACI3XJ_11395 [Oscillospiraceae bacterium]
MSKEFQPAPLSADPYGEEKFQFPLMKQIEDYAEEHDISILAATKVVVPEYALKLPWRDEEYFHAAEEWQKKDLAENAPKSLLRQFDKNKGPRGEGKHG